MSNGYNDTGYDVVIGLEIHVELNTKTKIFCGCSTEFGAEPNTHTCPVCTGMPGVLPVMNKGVLEKAIAAGLATNCDITNNANLTVKIISILICQKHIKLPNFICQFAVMVGWKLMLLTVAKRE